MDLPRPRAERIRDDLDALAEFVDADHPGWTRQAFTTQHRRAKDWLAEQLADAGMAVHEDAACNVIGVRPGSGPSATGPGTAPGLLATGSHLDTVRGGGRFDGIAGVVAGLEVARCLDEAGARLRHDLRVVDFTGEEANDFGLSCVGSRAVSGQLSDADLALGDGTGRTLGDALAAMGGDPDAIADARWPGVDAFVELHIEQGPVLAGARRPAGLVSGIVGIHREAITLTGRPDHAGTTPMDHRRDALVAASHVVQAVAALGARGGGVATRGALVVAPGAANVVPASAELLAEYRSIDAGWLQETGRRLRDQVARIADAHGVEAAVQQRSANAPVPCDTGVLEVLQGVTGDDHDPLPSGAGHDAAFLADLGPIGMVFVASRDGRSHCPEEWTDPEDVAVGADVLLRGLVALDGRTAAAR